MGGPQTKRMRQSLDDSSEGDDVRSYFMGLSDRANRSGLG